MMVRIYIWCECLLITIYHLLALLLSVGAAPAAEDLDQQDAAEAG